MMLWFGGLPPPQNGALRPSLFKCFPETKDEAETSVEKRHMLTSHEAPSVECWKTNVAPLLDNKRHYVII